MSIFDTIARGAIGGSSSGSGSKCGNCAALKAENARLEGKIKILEGTINNARRVAIEEEAKGIAGQVLNNPPIRQGMFEGMQATGGKVRRVL